ncbi:MAG: phospholipase D-like domain-containing protein [Gammaproteobacteria bacterium]|nr:phospholipase D-like domain-containing protein [Gammaproteobacteria bacterium]
MLTMPEHYHYILDWTLLILGHIAGIIGAIHALMTKKDPRAALGWTIVCIMLPGLGVILYCLFGINRIKSLALEWKSYGLSDVQHNTNAAFPRVHAKPESNYSLPEHYLGLIKTGNEVLKLRLSPGNALSVLLDGTEAYPKMIEAINNAKQSVYLSTYIFGATGIGSAFIDALAAAHNRGVEVKVLIDGVGVMYSWPSSYYRLRRKKVPVSLFLPPFRSWYYALHLNLRCHAKILVVDGKVGFTGGMNIHDSNYNPSGDPLIHDMHFQVNGPIIGQLQDVFLRYWYFSTKQQPKKIVYYDDTEQGSILCRGIDAGPYHEFPQLQVMLCAAVNGATTRIRIMTPYLILGYPLSSALGAAALRGVNVEIILPEANNLSFVKGASEAMMPGLLAQGVHFYYRPGIFAHTKLFMVDEACAIIGSSNLDTRSFYLNFEFNLEVYNQAFTDQLNLYFDKIKFSSHVITSEWLQSQAFGIKLRNSIFKLFSPYL